MRFEPYSAFVIVDTFPNTGSNRFQVRSCQVIDKQEIGYKGSKPLYVVRLDDSGEVKFYLDLYDYEETAEEIAKWCSDTSQDLPRIGL